MIRNHSGFTLVELLVVMAISAIFGTLMLTIFTNTLKGSNKSQVIGVIKQNGQSVLETIDKAVRNSDSVICPFVISPATSGGSDTLVVASKGGGYTRFRFIPPGAPVSAARGSCGNANGCILQDNPTKGPVPSSSPSRQETDPEFVNRICLADAALNSPLVLTDSNLQSGVSVDCPASPCDINPVFKREKSAGFMDQVIINFNLRPGAGAPSSVTGQISDVNFKTTIQLR